ncbi:hypothetical protein [Shewanella indica]|uniref:hypothetical protein n=1 Tax=Shewanella indica TaxID=768528 RepID=UPI0030041286
MDTSVILSYAFIYFVLFIAVPFVLVVFVMTCIKFFKSDEKNAEEIKLKNRFFDKQSLDFFKSLKSLTNGRYEVCSNVALESVVDIDPHATASYSRLDYVLIDQNSSEIKMVISDFSDAESANSKSLLEKLNVRLIDMKRSNPLDAQHLEQMLTA